LLVLIVGVLVRDTVKNLLFLTLLNLFWSLCLRKLTPCKEVI
jgi:hypothetical protein